MPTETAATGSRMHAGPGGRGRARGQAGRQRDRHVGAGDGRHPGAAVGLQDVAVDRDGARAERGCRPRPCRHGRSGAGSPCRAARRSPAAGVGGARQHGVFGGHPADPAVGEERRHPSSTDAAHSTRCRRCAPARCLGVLLESDLDRDGARSSSLARPSGRGMVGADYRRSSTVMVPPATRRG
jgi:hypothetical protein